jgi:Pyruvate/2-oxoacid:ferredoxin oxidoreductase gamma subunit
MTEIRWHARAGQGAKTASHLLALALLDAGKSVQAFPEYGPERRGAPLRAYTRYDSKPIRRHDSIEHPDVVVVLEPSLRAEGDVTSGLKQDGLVLDAAELGAPRDSTNLFMVGAVAGALGEPPLEFVQDRAVETLGRKADHDAIRAAVAAGYEAAKR